MHFLFMCYIYLLLLRHIFLLFMLFTHSLLIYRTYLSFIYYIHVLHSLIYVLRLLIIHALYSFANHI